MRVGGTVKRFVKMNIRGRNRNATDPSMQRDAEGGCAPSRMKMDKNVKNPGALISPASLAVADGTMLHTRSPSYGVII